MQVLNDFTTSVSKALGEIDPKWRDYDGLVVCGSHTPHNVEIIIDEIQKFREAGKPVLGICHGYQLAAIEYARNVLGIKDATSEEFGTEGTFVVKKRPEMLVGLHEGESWWSRYDVDKDFLKNWDVPRNFVVVPFHPEYQSSKEKPHPVLLRFLNLFTV